MPQHVRNIILAFVLLGSVTAAANAQQKIAYVNTDDILKQIPEYQGIQQQLQVVSDQWRQQLEDMQQQIDTLRQEFDAKKILFTDEVRAERQGQIQSLVNKRKQYLDEKFGPKGEYFQKQQELLEPIQRKVYEAITAVAQRQDIDFVFDRAKNASLLFGRNQWNLNPDVLQELGITLNE